MLEDMRNKKWILLSALLFAFSAAQAFADDPLEEYPPETSPSDKALYHNDQEAPPPPPSGQQTNAFIKPHPSYKDEFPTMGFSLGVAPNAFNGHQLAPQQNGEGARGLELLLDWQPRFLQGFWGLVDFGPYVTIYPINTSIFAAMDGTTKSLFSVWEPGAQIRYQARFVREQFLVPVFAYGISTLHYAFGSPTATTTGSYTMSNFTGGAWLLLSTFSNESAADFYDNWGVSRSYLTFEYRNMVGGGITLGSIFFGLRMEF
jgi:hypothetical protein